MKVIQTGRKFTLVDDSIRSYDKLPVATYDIGYDQREGCFLLLRENIHVTETAYGSHNDKREKVISSFKCYPRSLGVILSGDKGIGKTLFAKQICEYAVKEGYPIILVDACYKGISRFLESIQQECVVLFDEFDKMFRYSDDESVDDQASLLSLFDGTAGGKKLFIVTCNQLYSLNSYIVNRPGRFHYHFRFDYPKAEDITQYLRDKLSEKYYSEIEDVIDFSRRVSLNYDCLRSIAFELNTGKCFADAIADLNILSTKEECFAVYLYYSSGAVLHQFQYKTNLYDFGPVKTQMDRVRLYDDDGEYIVDAYFCKKDISFDFEKNEIMVPASKMKFDYSGAKDLKAVDNYKSIKPMQLVFRKLPGQKIHYVF